MRLGSEGCGQAGWPTIPLMRSAVPQHPETKSRAGPGIVTRVSQVQFIRQVCSNEAMPRTSQNIKSASQSQCPNQGGTWPVTGLMSECLGLNRPPKLRGADSCFLSLFSPLSFPSRVQGSARAPDLSWPQGPAAKRLFLKAVPLQYRQKHLPQHQKKRIPHHPE